jgi:hypothetical protein
MIAIQLEEIWYDTNGEFKTTTDEMPAVMVKNNELYYCKTGTDWGEFKKITKEDLECMRIGTFNKMVDDINKLYSQFNLKHITVDIFKIINNKGE